MLHPYSDRQRLVVCNPIPNPQKKRVDSIQPSKPCPDCLMVLAGNRWKELIWSIYKSNQDTPGSSSMGESFAYSLPLSNGSSSEASSIGCELEPSQDPSSPELEEVVLTRAITSSGAMILAFRLCKNSGLYFRNHSRSQVIVSKEKAHQCHPMKYVEPGLSSQSRKESRPLSPLLASFLYGSSQAQIAVCLRFKYWTN